MKLRDSEIDGGALLQKWCLRRDQQAFTKFFNVYSNNLYRMCFSLTRNRHTAQDLAAETFVRLLKSFESAPPEYQAKLFCTSNTFPLLVKIAYRLFLDELKKPPLKSPKTNYVENLPDCPDPEPLNSPSTTASLRETKEVVWEAIATRSQAEIDTIYKYYVEGKTYHEIGLESNQTEDAARHRLRRALKELRAEFESRGLRMDLERLAGLIALNLPKVALTVPQSHQMLRYIESAMGGMGHHGHGSTNQRHNINLLAKISGVLVLVTSLSLATILFLNTIRPFVPPPTSSSTDQIGLLDSNSTHEGLDATTSSPQVSSLQNAMGTDDSRNIPDTIVNGNSTKSVMPTKLPLEFISQIEGRGNIRVRIESAAKNNPEMYIVRNKELHLTIEPDEGTLGLSYARVIWIAAGGENSVRGERPDGSDRSEGSMTLTLPNTGFNQISLTITDAERSVDFAIGVTALAVGTSKFEFDSNFHPVMVTSPRGRESGSFLSEPTLKAISLAEYQSDHFKWFNDFTMFAAGARAGIPLSAKIGSTIHVEAFEQGNENPVGGVIFSVGTPLIDGVYKF
jgi:RNA polymerase sigma factor (sigma-70 family)